MNSRLSMLCVVSAVAMWVVGGHVTHAEESGTQGLPKWRDWPNWRGPFCNGSAIDYPGGLTDKSAEIKQLWESEEEMHPGLHKGMHCRKTGYVLWGFSSFAIVDRRLYFHHGRPYGEATPRSRAIMKHYLTGHFQYGKENKKGVPSDALDWHARVRGTDVFMCLDAVTGRTLWKAELEDRAVNIQYVRCTPYYPHNVPCWGEKRLFGQGTSLRVHAMDAVTGEPLWESDLGPAAWWMNYMYIDTCENSRYTNKDGRHGQDFGAVSSMTVAGGAVIGRCHDSTSKFTRDRLTAFDLRTGRRLWVYRGHDGDGLMKSIASPLRWCAADGKEYVIIYGMTKTGDNQTNENDAKVLCLDPMTGEEVWSHTPFSCSGGTIAVSRDWMVSVRTGKTKRASDPQIHMYVFRISPQGAKLMHKIPGFANDGCSPSIYKGKAYFGTFGGQKQIVDLETGTVTKIGYGNGLYADTISNDTMAAMRSIRLPDGPHFDVNINAKGNPGFLPEFSYGEMNMVLGRLFVRARSRWFAYDFRKDQSIIDRYSTPVAPDHEVSIDSKHEAVKALGVAHWTDRTAAIERFPTDKVEAAEELARLVIDAPYPTAKAASKVLCRMGDAAKTVAPTLAAALPTCAKSAGYGRILSLTQAIAAIDATAFEAQVPALAALLTTDDDLIRFRTCRALEEMGPRAAAAAPALIELLKTKDTYSFRYAALALAAIGDAAGQAAADELSTHLDTQNGEILVHALVALKEVGGTLSDDTLAKLMDFAFEPDKNAITVCRAQGASTKNPELNYVHYVSYLAAKSLSARPEQCLDRVIAHLQSTRKISKGDSAPPVLMHYAVLGEIGKPALKALSLLESRLGGLVLSDRFIKKTLPNVCKAWIQRLKESAETE